MEVFSICIRKKSCSENFFQNWTSSKFDQRDYQHSEICYEINKWNIYRFFQFAYAGWIYCESSKSFYLLFSEKRRIECKIIFITSEISRNFFFSISYIISKTNDRIKKIY